MNKQHWIIAALAALAVFSTGCEVFVPSEPEEEDFLDEPFDDLTEPQMKMFIKGDAEFNRIRTFAEGVGPIFNATSCGTCHPGEGRSHPEFGLIRFGKYDENGDFDPMHYAGGPQLQDRAAPGYQPETIPKDATGVTLFIGPSVTGLGLLEAVDDATLIELAERVHDDGVQGRVHYVEATDKVREMASFSDNGNGKRLQIHDGTKMVGRFGWKGAQTSLLHQTVMAYHQDMGMTSYFEKVEPYNHSLGAATVGSVGAPDLASDELFAVAYYLRTLRPPIRRNVDDPNVKAGEKIFEEIGCASCHVPSLPVGKADIGALDDIDEIYAYTDLLLHDMGPELDDGYTEGDAKSSEYRTPPLWGIGLAAKFQSGRPFLMHDGRATSFPDAIEFHGGTAAHSRTKFKALSASEQQQLIKFLESL